MKLLLTLLIITSQQLFATNEIQQINELLQDEKSLLQCSGLDLVKSCGNWKCESQLGENEKTCPSDCIVAPVRSYNQIILCNEVQKIFKPTTIDQFKEAVNYANQNQLRVKVVGQMHSATDVLCNSGVVISTQNYNNIIGIEKFEGHETVKVESGAIIYDLAQWLHQRGKSLGFPIMGFRGVSMGGAASTGSHGSSPKHTAVISNTIASMTVLNADGEIHEYSEKSTTPTRWRALKASLGMLGVILEMRFKIQPQFNLDVRVTYHDDRELLEQDGVLKVVENCDYGQLNWFPGTNKFVKTCGTKTNAKADAGATNALLDPMVPGLFVKPVKQVLQLGACYNGVACLMEKVRYSMFKSSPPLKKFNKKGKLKAAHAVVGPSHQMMSSQLTKHQEGFFQMDWEIVVPASKAQNALYKIYSHLKANKVCLPLVGVFIRYAPSEDQTLIAHTVSEGDFKENEPTVFMEIPVYLPTAFSPEEMQKYERPYVEFAKFLIEEFSGRPHWGKNRQWVFDLQKSLNGYGQNMEKFKKIVTQMDPNGLFANKFGASLGLEWSGPNPINDFTNHPCSLKEQIVCDKNNKKYHNKCFAQLAGVDGKACN